MKRILILVALAIFGGNLTYGQQNFKISSNSAGGIRLGMTVNQARKVLKGCGFKRSGDGEGLTLIAVTCSGRHIMTVFAGEEADEVQINEGAKIEFIEIWDKRFKTVDGIHPEMQVSVAEKRLGKVKEIILTQTESREFVTFARKRKGISFRMYGGIYAPRETKTARYERGTTIHSIQVSNY